MATLYYLSALAFLVLCVAILLTPGKSRSAKENQPLSPPLPPRGNMIDAIPPARPAARAPFAPPPPLPPRQNRARTTPALSTGTIPVSRNRGPRGQLPNQFPCCPFDKLRNLPGQAQVIFWDSGAECYRCSRGHQFRSNGKP